MSFSPVPEREAYQGAPAIFLQESGMIPDELPVVLATGILAVALSFALDRVWAGVPSRPLYLFVRLPGVVLHECAHIAGCLVTGAKVRDVVLFSDEGGSVTYTRPLVPYIGDVLISTAPLFLLPLALYGITWLFSAYLGCIVPAFPETVTSAPAARDLVLSVAGAFSANLIGRFNGWFLLYLYLTVSLVLALAPSVQDMKNAAIGTVILLLAGALVLLSGISQAITALAGLVHIIGSGLLLALVFGLIALAASLPLLLWQLLRRRA